MALREKYGQSKPLKGARIAGCLHMTIQTAVLIETLVELGAEVTWSSCNIFSTQDHAAAAIAETGVPVYAWKGMTEEEFDWCIEQTLFFPDGKPLNLILDDGGDLTAMVHEKYPELLGGIKRPVRRDDHRRPSALPDARKGRIEDAGDQRQRLGHQEQVRQPVRLPRIAGRRHQAGDRRHGRRQSRCGRRLRRRRQRLCPFDAALWCPRDRHRNRSDQCLAGRMEGFEVTTMEEAASIGNIFVTTTGNCDVITGEHLAQMQNDAIVCNIGHFELEIDIAWLEDRSRLKARSRRRDQAARWIATPSPMADSIHPAGRRPPGQSGLCHRAIRRS